MSRLTWRVVFSTRGWPRSPSSGSWGALLWLTLFTSAFADQRKYTKHKSVFLLLFLFSCFLCFMFISFKPTVWSPIVLIYLCSYCIFSSFFFQPVKSGTLHMETKESGLSRRWGDLPVFTSPQLMKHSLSSFPGQRITVSGCSPPWCSGDVGLVVF